VTGWGDAASDAYLPAEMVLGHADIAVIVTDRLSNLLYLNEFAGITSFLESCLRLRPRRFRSISRAFGPVEPPTRFTPTQGVTRGSAIRLAIRS
jgi:hypothetical protein